MTMVHLHYFKGLIRLPLLPLAVHNLVISLKRKATEKSGHNGLSVRRAHFTGVPAALRGVEDDAAPRSENKQLSFDF